MPWTLARTSDLTSSHFAGLTGSASQPTWPRSDLVVFFFVRIGQTNFSGVDFYLSLPISLSHPSFLHFPNFYMRPVLGWANDDSFPQQRKTMISGFYYCPFLKSLILVCFNIVCRQTRKHLQVSTYCLFLLSVSMVMQLLLIQTCHSRVAQNQYK